MILISKQIDSNKLNNLLNDLNKICMSNPYEMFDQADLRFMRRKFKIPPIQFGMLSK